jgi:hypothetical protein
MIFKAPSPITLFEAAKSADVRAKKATIAASASLTFNE